uniref:SLED domain-containing protein n=1 Tax=Syphacia muris TaxID=451379 RepID=A0A0N5AID4_9BILA
MTTIDPLPSSDDEDRLTLQILVDPPSPSPSVTQSASPVSVDDEKVRSQEQLVASDNQETGHVAEDTSAVKSKKENSDEVFSWPEYIRETKSKAAPPNCFFQDPKPPVNNFKAKMKVEVPDLRGNGTQCLATIQHVHCVWICVRLDGEDTSNDHWMICDDRSILPVGTNKKKGNPIQPPYGYKYSISGFHKFIENQLKPNADGESPAAPSSIFRPISSSLHPQKNKFEVGMKCEAVDYKNFNGRPSPATIVEVDGDNVTINFDGWNNSYNLKMRYDSRYLFPIGWSAKNGLAINPPQKIQGKSKYASVRNQTSLKSVSDKLTSQSPFLLKSKGENGKQPSMKKRKTASVSGGSPKRKIRSNSRRQSFNLLSSLSQKSYCATSGKLTKSSNNEVKNIKKEMRPLSNAAVSSSHSEQRAFSSETLKSIVPLQRPIARKTIPNFQAHQSLPKKLSIAAQQRSSGRSQFIPMNTVSSQISVSCATAAYSSQQSSSIESVNLFNSQLLPVASSSMLDTPHLQVSKDTFLDENSNKSLRLLVSKSRAELSEEKLESAPIATGIPAPDILLTADEQLKNIENSKMTVHINHFCNCSPPLDRKKVRGLPYQIGPGSYHHVFRETVQQIINCSIDSRVIFNEIKPATSHILSVTASFNGVTYVRALPVLNSPLDAWDRLKELVAVLKICPNFLTDKRVVCKNCNSKERYVSNDESPDYNGNGSEDLRDWSVEKVAGEIENTFDALVASRFRQNQIDGQALMLLSTDLLMQYLEMPFGPALKMVNFVDNLRKKHRR